MGWKTWAIIIIIILGGVSILLLPVVFIRIFTPPVQCPVSCDDLNPCTVDYCGPESYLCIHEKIPGCCGNGRCEPGEFPYCGDCPSCRDGNRCTTDEYDYIRGRCTHQKIEPESMLTDRFDGGMKWINFSDWTLATDRGNSVMNITSGAMPVIVIPTGNYTIRGGNYTFGMKMKIRRGGAIIDFRKTGESTYRLNITDGMFRLHKITSLKRILLTAFDSVEKNTWTDIKVAAIGNEIIVLLNGKHFFSYQDTKNPILTGSVGLGGYRHGDNTGEVLFDDITVKKTGMSNYEC